MSYQVPVQLRTQEATRAHYIQMMADGAGQALGSLAQGYADHRKGKEEQKRADAEAARQRRMQAAQLSLQQQESERRDQAFRAQQADRESLIQGQLMNIEAQGARIYGQGPHTQERAQRFSQAQAVARGIKDPKAQAQFADEFLANEKATLLQDEIQDDMTLGNLQGVDDGEEIEEILAALQNPGLTAHDVDRLRAGYGEVKRSLIENQKKHALKNWGTQRIQQVGDMIAPEDTDAHMRINDVLARWTYGDIKSGEQLERALKGAKAGLSVEDMSRVDMMRMRESAIDLWQKMNPIEERLPTHQELQDVVDLLQGVQRQEHSQPDLLGLGGAPGTVEGLSAAFDSPQVQRSIAANKAERRSSGRQRKSAPDAESEAAAQIVRPLLKSGASPEEITSALQEQGIDPESLPLEFYQALGAERGVPPPGKGPKKKPKRKRSTEDPNERARRNAEASELRR